MVHAEIPVSEYEVPFFKEQGFLRKRCKVCGEHFWTQVPDMKVCGESPCQEYTFIGESPTRKPYDLREMREAFLSFFEKRGHQRVSPYPVVARWRDDLYFTDASIVDFQPYVTNGIIPPVANPLVISQPCLRFVDIDNVGLTFGRHLTVFEMGGAHAFNYPDKEVYWSDQTVRYHHEFVVKELGVKSEEVTYKEGVWSGGGNAGPDVESIIRGLEVATLVFMRYKVVDNKLVELPIRTVDTGYGMERYTWLSQGSLSSFHAIYGSILDKVLKAVGLSPDEGFLSEYAKYSGAMRLEKVANALKLRSAIARKLNMDVNQLHSLLTPIEEVFAVLDHTKSLSFMLAEGVVPSNVREGYLTRLMIRRTLRLLRSLGIEHELDNIVDMQIAYWSRDFPHLKETADEILDILTTEADKYRESIRRGAKLVEKMCQELRKKGRGEVPLDMLIELYDSQGLPPAVVSEIVAKEGLRAEVPDDFYNRVAARHLKAEPEVVPREELEERLSSLPETVCLFHEKPYLKEFEAEVLSVVDYKYVILDRTAFYPEGGGQLADEGILTWEGGRAEVRDVQRVGNVIIHLVEGDVPATGVKVKGRIDWGRRLSLTRHHTATHILLGALRRVLGEHAWQAGAQKEVSRSRLDVSHHKRIEVEQLKRIEALANEVIMANIPVKVLTMPRERAESLYGFRLYQGGVVPGRDVRVVKIGDWDVEACGGTHCRTTGEVGFIKILRSERIQDGVERVVFAAGIPAVKASQERDEALRKISETCKVQVKLEDVAKVADAVERLFSSWKQSRKEVEKLEDELVKSEAKRLVMDARAVANVKLLTQVAKNVSVERLIKLAAELVRIEPKLVVALFRVDKDVRIVTMVGDGARELGIHAGNLAEEVASVVGGAGGGKADFGQGGGPLAEKVQLAIKKAEDLLAG